MNKMKVPPDVLPSEKYDKEASTKGFLHSAKSPLQDVFAEDAKTPSRTPFPGNKIG